MDDMRSTFAKIIGSTVAFLALGSIFFVGVRAQQTTRSSPAITTNWVGYLVAGQNDTSDRITLNPGPTVVGQVEIGLRSDGIVVWRESTKTK
jgi:hypothetical protein